MGPICFPGQLQKIQKMVQEARDSGARIVTGGDDRDLGGLFYAPDDRRGRHQRRAASARRRSSARCSAC